MTPFNRFVLSSPVRLAMPIAVYPGLQIAGGTVRQMVTDPKVQTAAVLALRERYSSRICPTAMDLSCESEAFGATIRMEDNEVPTVLGRLITDAVGVEALQIPKPGSHRTAVHIEAVRQVAQQRKPGQLVLGGVIGPFSLAGRLWGVSEFLELSSGDPDTAQVLIDKCTDYLIGYARLFKAAGADGIVMAEPTAGLLSPRSLARCSSPYVQRIVTAVEDENFGIILHNCGAKAAHLDAIFASGASAFHFGAPMDLAIALDKAGPERVICGNLDPSAVFVGLDAAGVAAKSNDLHQRFRTRTNFVASSGCDIPPQAPLANLDAFFAAFAQSSTATSHG